MATLKNNHKSLIVKELACFTTPSEIAKQLQEEFGVTVTLSQLSFYNPENTQGRYELSEKWRHLFHQTRDDFIEGIIEIPIVHKRYRLSELQKIYDTLYERGEYMQAVKVLEQAAKEMGGVYGDVQSMTESQRQEKKRNFYQEVNEKIRRTILEEDGEY